MSLPGLERTPEERRRIRLAHAKRALPFVAPELMAGRLTYINASVRDDCGGPLTALDAHGWLAPPELEPRPGGHGRAKRWRLNEKGRKAWEDIR